MRITHSIVIDESEISERFVHASGPGGQNVNKVATAVELRFDVNRTQALTPEVRARLAKIAGRRLSGDGVLVIQAHRYRSQARNRDDARARLAELLRTAATPPKIRRATRPSRAAKKRRLENKIRHSQLKDSRRRRPDLA